MKKLIIAGLLALGVTGHAAANGSNHSGNRLLPMCLSSSNFQSGYCLGYAVGMNDGMHKTIAGYMAGKELTYALPQFQ